MRRKLQKCQKSITTNIPKAFTEHFGLKVGDEVDFRLEMDHIRIMPVRPSAKTDVQAAQHQAIRQGEGID
jgi:antitoxin component of MazEF toxin-antitoxin module